MINEKCTKRYCSEDISKIENYAQAVADTTQTWHCHHRLEVQGQFRNSKKLLKKCGMYYYVPASQLIFLTQKDHLRIHRVGTHHSVESKKKMSMSLSGKHHSEETRKKISMSLSGEKNHMFGRKLSWWNNGTINKRSEKCPGQGWVRGRKPH